MGYTLYDALIDWDLSRSDVAAPLKPGLATGWSVDEAEKTRWTIRLRPGVRFHDGSLVDADAIVWNLDKVFNKDAPQYSPAVVAQVLWRLPGIASYRKIDAMTVEITTKGPDATLPYQLAGLMIASPARWRDAGSWQAFARNPSGTGPWTAAESCDRRGGEGDALVWHLELPDPLRPGGGQTPAGGGRLRADKPLHLRFMISTSGSGQMYPLPMNEFVQQNLADVGVKLDLEVLEWQALRARRDAGGAKGAGSKGIDAINNSWNSMDPLSAFLRHVDSTATPPAGLNWGFLNDPELDKLAAEARETFDPKAQDAVLAKIDTRMVDQADWIFVVHDVNPRAVTNKVSGLVEAQSWYVDFSPVSVPRTATVNPARPWRTAARR